MKNRPSLKGGGCCLFTLTLARFSLAYIQKRLSFCFDTVSAFMFFVSGRELMRTNATCNSVRRLLGWGEAAREEMVSGWHSILQALLSSATIPSSAPDAQNPGAASTAFAVRPSLGIYGLGPSSSGSPGFRHIMPLLSPFLLELQDSCVADLVLP